jgi:D-3-phosphoglycerate dehydrogenase
VQKAAPALQVICKHGTGTDNIDVAAATAAGIPVLYTPFANFESVAEHTLALMLSLARQIPQEDRRIRSGVFDKKHYGGLELNGKTLGLIGFGKIARRLCELVAPLRMRVLAYHPSAKPEPLPEYITKTADVMTVFREADVLSLHCPLTEQTRHLVNRETLAAMKRGALLVNTARGEIVNEADLLAALESGQLGGAALDVFEKEPLPADHPFVNMPQVICTPHVAGASDYSLRNMGMQSVQQVLAVLQGETPDPVVVVNPDVFNRSR